MPANEAAIENWFDKCEQNHLLPWEYDFKSELTDIDKLIDDEQDPIKRLLVCWQHEDSIKSEVEKTELAISIYSVLWKFDTSNPKRIDLDVMNSFWTSYKLALKLKYNNSPSKWIEQGLGRRLNYETMEKLIQNYTKYSEVNDLFRNLAKYTHTIGNLIVETKGFNRGRANDDYWDLALLEVKAYFDLINTTIWKDYIDKMYLRPFVSNNYEISELWKDHFLKSMPVKPKPEDCSLRLINEFQSRACSSIEERGKFMIKSLCEKTGLTNYSFYETQLKDLYPTPKFSNELWK